MINLKLSDRVLNAHTKVGMFLFKMMDKSSCKNEKINLSSLDSSYCNKIPNNKLINKIYNKLLDQSNHHYGNSIGDLKSRKALSKILSNDIIEFNEDDVIICHGGTGALNILLLSVLDPNDSIIIGKPCYTLYSTVSTFLNINILFFEYDIKNSLIDFDKLRYDILKKEKKPKAIFIIDPSNPINIQLNKNQIENFFKICQEFNMFLILDNIFQKNIYEIDNFNDYVNMHVKYKVPIFVTASITKSFNFPGCRFGYILKIDTEGSLKHIWEDGLKNFVQIPLSINTYIQKGVKEFFEENPDGDLPMIKKDLERYKSNSDFIMNKLKNNSILNPLKNSSSWFMYIGLDLSKIKYDTVEDFVIDLYDKTNILIYPSDIFLGREPYFRMSIGLVKDILDLALDRIIEFINLNLIN